MENSRSPGTVSLGEVLLVNVFAGLVEGAILVCFLDRFVALFGLPEGYSVPAVTVKMIVAVLVSGLGIVPLAAIARLRSDVLSIVLGGSQQALWGLVLYVLGSTYQLGKPPEFVWTLYGGFILWGLALNIAVVLVVRALGRRTTATSVGTAKAA